MKLALRIAIGLSVLVGVLLLGGLLCPSGWDVQREIRTTAEPTVVFAKVADFREWDRWSPRTRGTEWDVETSSEGPHGAVGAERTWKGDRVGSGRMTATAVDSPREFAYELDVGGMYSGAGVVSIESDGDTTVVRWRESGDVGYDLFSRYFMLAMDSIVGAELERGLERLRTVVEDPGAGGGVGEGEAPADGNAKDGAESTDADGDAPSTNSAEAPR